MEFIVMYFLFYGYVCPSCFEMFALSKWQSNLNFDEMGRNENLLVKKRCL